MREEDVLQVLGGSFFNSVLVDIEKNTYTRMNFAPWLLKISQTGMYTGLADFIIGFSRLRTLEFFVFRKMEMPETKNHLLCGWRQSVVQKNHLSVTIELFRHYCKKGKVILWRIRIMI